MWHVCGMGELHTRFRLGDMTERDHLGDLGVYGNIILNLTLKKFVEWIALTQDRDRLRAFVIVVMNIRFPQNTGNFLSS
jgi:hypothetical protein